MPEIEREFLEMLEEMRRYPEVWLLYIAQAIRDHAIKLEESESQLEFKMGFALGYSLAQLPMEKTMGIMKLVGIELKKGDKPKS